MINKQRKLRYEEKGRKKVKTDGGWEHSLCVNYSLWQSVYIFIFISLTCTASVACTFHGSGTSMRTVSTCCLGTFVNWATDVTSIAESLVCDDERERERESEWVGEWSCECVYVCVYVIWEIKEAVGRQTNRHKNKRVLSLLLIQLIRKINN